MVATYTSLDLSARLRIVQNLDRGVPRRSHGDRALRIRSLIQSYALLTPLSFLKHFQFFLGLQCISQCCISQFLGCLCKCRFHIGVILFVLFCQYFLLELLLLFSLCQEFFQIFLVLYLFLFINVNISIDIGINFLGVLIFLRIEDLLLLFDKVLYFLLFFAHFFCSPGRFGFVIGGVG